MSEKLSNTYFASRILCRCLPNVKKYFQLHKLRFSFIRHQRTQIFIFLVKAVWEIPNITAWEQKVLKNIFFSKNVRQLHQLTSYNRDLNTRSFLVVTISSFREIKGHSLTTRHCQIYYFAMEVLWTCLPYVRSYFQSH